MSASRLELGASHSAVTIDTPHASGTASAIGVIELVVKQYTMLMYYVINARRLSAFSCAIPMPPSTHPPCSTLTPPPGLHPPLRPSPGRDSLDA